MLKILFILYIYYLLYLSLYHYFNSYTLINKNILYFIKKIHIKYKYNRLY